MIIWLIKRLPRGSTRLIGWYTDFLKRTGIERVAITSFGAKLACNLNDVVSRCIFLFGIWEPNTTNVILKTLKNGDVFVDVGANIGYYTLLASKQVGSTGRVVSIEALPEVFKHLESNVAANFCHNVRLVNVAVADEMGEIPIYGSPSSNRGMSSIINYKDWPVEAFVSAAPLDKILSAEEMKRLCIIKIDIEGAEAPVLSRIVDTLELYNPNMQILVELSPGIAGKSASDVFRKLISAGFDAYLIENEYDINWYLRWRRPKPPTRIVSLGALQGDILFKRPQVEPIPV